MRKSQRIALLLIITTFALTACGQKGPLFLTEDQLTQAQDAALGADDEKEKAKAE